MSNLKEVVHALPDIALAPADAPITGNREAGLSLLRMDGEKKDIAYYAEWLRVNVPRLKHEYDNDDIAACIVPTPETVANVYAVMRTTTLSLGCRIFLEAFVRFLIAVRNYMCVDFRSEATPQIAGYKFYAAPLDATGKLVYLVTNAEGRVLDRNDKVTCLVISEGMRTDMVPDENRPRLIFNM
jgi:hypothetical protein